MCPKNVFTKVFTGNFLLQIASKLLLQATQAIYGIMLNSAPRLLSLVRTCAVYVEFWACCTLKTIPVLFSVFHRRNATAPETS